MTTLAVKVSAAVLSLLSPPIGTTNASATDELPAWHAASRPTPNVPFSNQDGARLTLADMKGRVLVINFWATWCTPCIEELPGLNELQRELGGERFQVVTISIDAPGFPLARFLEHHGWKHLTAYSDADGALLRATGAPGVPTSLVIDAQGREVTRLSGSIWWAAPAIKTRLKQLMK